MNNNAQADSPQDIAVDPTYGEHPKYRWFVLGMLTLVYTFNFIDRQILVILQEPIKAELGLSDAQLGLLTGFSFALVYVLAGIPIAWLADRGNRRNVVAISLAVWSGMTALSGLVQNYSQLVLARLGVGLGEAGGSPPAHSMLSDYFPQKQRATAVSIYTTGIYLGVLFGFGAGGWIAQNLGWRQAFFIIGVPGVIFAVILALFVKEPLRGRYDRATEVVKKASLKQTLTALKRRRSFWLIAMGCAMTSFVGYGNGNFFPSLLIREHGLSISDVGFILGFVAGIAGATGTFLGGFLADKLAVKDIRWYVWVPMIGCAVCLLPALYTLLGTSTTLVLIVLFPVNVLNSFYLGPSIAMAQTMVSPGMRAMTSAVLFFILNMIGLGLGPLIVGILSDVYQPIFGENNLRYAMITTLAIGSSGVLFYWLAGRTIREDLELPK